MGPLKVSCSTFSAKWVWIFENYSGPLKLRKLMMMITVFPSRQSRFCWPTGHKPPHWNDQIMPDFEERVHPKIPSLMTHAGIDEKGQFLPLPRSEKKKKNYGATHVQKNAKLVWSQPSPADNCCWHLWVKYPLPFWHS